jgi:hypothetical protein
VPWVFTAVIPGVSTLLTHDWNVAQAIVFIAVGSMGVGAGRHGPC